MECGFNSLCYFIRTFRQKKQVSPKEFQLKAVRGAE
ncbi:MAG: AraC family transcriptional regulator [Lewinellaceae bacterium]|nr:AraC family transcriptional regulator [Lewinellaceae bacterium]